MDKAIYNELRDRVLLNIFQWFSDLQLPESTLTRGDVHGC